MTSMGRRMVCRIRAALGWASSRSMRNADSPARMPRRAPAVWSMTTCEAEGVSTSCHSAELVPNEADEVRVTARWMVVRGISSPAVRTKLPRPWMTSSSPSARRVWMASRSVGLETPYCWHRTGSVGIWLPGSHRPRRMAWRSWSASCWCMGFGLMVAMARP